MKADEYPAIVRHMALAIYAKHAGGKSRAARFKGALQIATGRCVAYGILTVDSPDRPTRATLTSKGVHKNAPHLREAGVVAKGRLFASLLEMVRVEEEIASGPKDPLGVVTESSQLLAKLEREAEELERDPSVR